MRGRWGDVLRYDESLLSLSRSRCLPSANPDVPAGLLRHRVRNQSLDGPAAAGPTGRLAVTQWHDLRRLLEEAGATIECMDASAGHARPGFHGQRGTDISQHRR